MRFCRGADVDRARRTPGTTAPRASRPRGRARGASLVDLEAAEPLVDVGDEARLGVFAVVDDVDAELDLLLHDLLHRARQPRRARGLVDRLALLLGREHVQQIGAGGAASRRGW